MIMLERQKLADLQRAVSVPQALIVVCFGSAHLTAAKHTIRAVMDRLSLPGMKLDSRVKAELQL